VEAASRAFQNKHVQPFEFDTDVADQKSAQGVIRRLRSWVDRAPRDSIALIEYARLQALFGSRRTASNAISQAIHIDPDSRFVLRAATRFFTFDDQPDRALFHLRATPRIKVDPLLQSAEIATSELMDESSKIAQRALREFLQNEKGTLLTSELGMSLATLEEKNGVKKRRVDSIVKRALFDPTENALAQAIWLVEHTNRDFGKRFPETNIPDDAFEAHALQYLENGQFEQAAKSCSNWYRMQPFQSRAPLILSTINFSFLARFEEAARVASAAIRLHGKDWRLLNILTISLARKGDVALAEEAFDTLKSVASGHEQMAFVFAARGMLDFTKGAYRQGLEAYVKSIDEARKARRNDLILTAAMHFLEMSTLTGSLSQNDSRSLAAAIEDQINKKFWGYTKDVQRLWDVKRLVIRDNLETSEFLGTAEPLDGSELLRLESAREVLASLEAPI
jgi:tetratricopeptide (TPR) repeat protein